MCHNTILISKQTIFHNKSYIYHYTIAIAILNHTLNRTKPYWIQILQMFIRAGQGMLGLYFPHFRLVRTAFHAQPRGRGRECVWEGGRVSALLRCFNNCPGQRYTSKRPWSPLSRSELIEPSEVCDLSWCARLWNTNNGMLFCHARLRGQHQ